MTNPLDPAFPIHPEASAFQASTKECVCGLTKREYFSAMAMHGILSSQQHNAIAKTMAIDAVIMADVLIAMLSEDPK